MHRTIEITAPPAATDNLIGKLEELEYIVGLSVQRGASVVPPGEVLTVHALNRDADRVTRIVDEARSEGQVSVV